jgi:FAD/FMN-containing dehydrogenase
VRRRRLLQWLTAFPAGSLAESPRAARASLSSAVSRVRPGDTGWPTASEWESLRRSVAGNLINLQSPRDNCRATSASEACRNLFRELKNPYFVRDNPALTQTCGWVDAWTAQPSTYVVAARETGHVVAAVNFARERNLRLVIKGAGHSYLGTSNAADSLLIWTRAMDDILVHDAFVPQGCEGRMAPVPAVTVGAGAIWMHTYQAVTSGADRYVQGGGCGTVGVAGHVQGGGFGTYSKAFGTAGASLLEAEVVTAGGSVHIANAFSEPDLFWALKGGGGGSFGVVTRMTLRTWKLPTSFGSVSTTIRARSVDAYRRLIGAFVAFYASRLCNPHWGELVRTAPDHRLEISMNFQGFDAVQASTVWKPFLDWVAAQDDLVMTTPVVLAGPGHYRWDGAMLERYVPGTIRHDDRPGAPAANFFWAANYAEAGHVIHDFQSLWLPADLLRPEQQTALADALVAASRHWAIEMHFQKGLAGAPAEVATTALETPMNPNVVKAFMLAIVASEGPPAFPGIPDHEPNVSAARSDKARIAEAMAELRKVAPESGAYAAESSYFQPDWQRAYWGLNYQRLLAVKRRYDPHCLFFTRHGVGSEGWSDDGFTRLA